MTHKISDQASDRPAGAQASGSDAGGPGRVALARMRRLIGGAFGLIYVVTGAGALPSPAAPVLRILAIAAFVALLITARRTITGPGDRVREIAPFSRGYSITVAAEAAAIAAGVVMLSAVLQAPHAISGCVSLVVGVHFFGLAHVWKQLHRFYTRLGAAITACGVAGLAAAAAGASAAVIAAIAAITPGVLLLASSFLAIRRYRRGEGAADGPAHAPPGAAQDPKTIRDFTQWPADASHGAGQPRT
jgi:hypothetical protein